MHHKGRNNAPQSNGRVLTKQRAFLWEKNVYGRNENETSLLNHYKNAEYGKV